jgi:WhiB family redox-sensing transcriptional regulator
VRAECLAYALNIREPHGIWGGLTEAERRVLIADEAG